MDTIKRLRELLRECRTCVVAVRALCPTVSYSRDHNTKLLARIDAALKGASDAE